MLFPDRNPDGSRTTMRTFRTNTNEENAQLFAWHDNEQIEPGQVVWLDYNATPEIKDRVIELLQCRYGWTIELDGERRVWMRKPAK